MISFLVAASITLEINCSSSRAATITVIIGKISYIFHVAQSFSTCYFAYCMAAQCYRSYRRCSWQKIVGLFTVMPRLEASGTKMI